MRRSIPIGLWILALMLLGSAEGRAQVSPEYEELVARLVAVETRLAQWEGERDERYRGTVDERDALVGAVRSATEAHLAAAKDADRGPLETRLMTKRNLGALEPRAGEEPRGLPPDLDQTKGAPGPPELPSPAGQAAAGLDVAAEAGQQGQEIAAEARERARDAAEQARQRAEEISQDARERGRRVAEEARDRARDAADDAREGFPGHP